MAIFKEALNPFGKVFGDMSPSGKNNAYANAIMFNAVGNKLREGRKIAAANNLSYGGVDDQGEHIFAPAGVYQPIQEAAEGIAGLLDSRPLPPDMGLTQQEGPRIFPPTHGDPLPPEMLPIPPIDPNLEMIGGPLPEPPEMLPPPIYDFDYPEPAPIDPYIQPPIQFPTPGEEADTYPDSFGVPERYVQPDTLVGETGPKDYAISQTVEDPFTFEEDPVAVEVPIEDPVPFGAPIATATPIGQPIDTGTNPFYAGATNVAQPPSMTPVAPSFSLDVGMGGMGGFTPTITSSTPGNAMYDYYTQPQTTAAPATDVAPQTTATPLPTVNSFAGFNGFGGFGGF